LAALEGRVVVTRDVRTMPRHFIEFTGEHRSPGIILIPRNLNIGDTVDRLLRLWVRWDAKDIENQVWWLRGR
jgi:hypothetical protein